MPTAPHRRLLSPPVAARTARRARRAGLVSRAIVVAGVLANTALGTSAAGAVTAPATTLVANFGADNVTSYPLTGALHFNTAASKPGPKPVWHTSATAPPVPALPPNPEVNIEDLACPSAGNCVAVGSYLGSSNSGRALIESERTGRWIAAPAPTPVGAATPASSELGAVACTSAGDCTAVGSYMDRAHQVQGLIVSQAKGTWSASKAPLPKGMSSLLPQSAFSLFPVGLLGVACPQTGGCVASGAGELQSESVAVVLVQSKGRWSASRAALPPGAGEISLTGLACSRPGACVITGSLVATASHPFILSLSNGTWSSRDAPAPAAAAGNPNLEVGPVACPASGSCIAVGDYPPAAGISKGFLLTGSGTTWRVMPAPTPPGDAKANTYLGDVACTRAGTCTAVGDIILSETNGRWRAAPAPVAVGSPAKYVDYSDYSLSSSPLDLACNAAGCAALAVNMALDSDPVVLLSGRPGGAWQARAVPLPHAAGARSPAGAGAAIGGVVACPAASACIAAGEYYDASANVQGMLIGHTTAGWSATIAPLPADAGHDLATVQLGSVTCPAEGLCTAIGELDNDGVVVRPLAETLRNGAWQATAIRLPADAAQPQLQPDVPSKLLVNGQACPAAISCVGVGDYEDSAGEDQGLVLSGTGPSWDAVKAPLPTGGATTNQVAVTQAVTCTSAGSCTAVGTYTNPRGNIETLVLTGSNGAWRVTTVPLPPRVTTLGWGGGYVSVDCPAPGSCVAVGSYTASNGYSAALILSESAGRWTTISAPLPPGTVTGGKYAMSELDALACRHAGSCYAVGSYSPSGNSGQPLLETETGSTWRAVDPPQPPGASEGAELNAIACPGSCVATGDYENGNVLPAEVYILSGSGARWSAHTVTLPRPGARGAMTLTLGALSCPAAGSCVAAGSYSAANGDNKAVWLAEPGAAAGRMPTWLALPAPLPPGSEVTSLGRDGTITSVSCPHAGWCLALGTFDNAGGAATPLFESLTSG